MEGNASVYKVYPVSRITGEGRAAFLRSWGAGCEQEGAGGGGDNSICVRKLKILEGDISDGCERNASVYHAYYIL